MQPPNHKHTALLLVAILFLGTTQTASAFTEDLLIADHDFANPTAMSLAEVQTFLQELNSPLATRYLADSSGALKTPAEIIWFAAQEARISPRVLLATLQKEQRLVTHPNPSTRQIDYAMGYGCPDGAGCGDRFRGFGKQMRGAALQFRGYLDDLRTKGETIARWAVGRPRATGDGFTIAPRNSATAALYSYTPWRGGGATTKSIGGNLSFTRIFRQWFGTGAWPDGTILQATDGTRWLLQNGKRRQFLSEAAFAIRSASATVIAAPQADVESYAQGVPIRFADYAIVEGPDRVRWLLVGDFRRKIASRELFRKLGFHPDEVETTTNEILASYIEGTPIATVADDPRGTLVRERETGKIFLVTGSRKQPILDPAIQRVRFPGEQPITRKRNDLRKLKADLPITLPDGVLVTAPKYLPSVFIISRGTRRPFGTSRTFELLGYPWSSVLHVSNAALELHPPADPIDGEIAAPPPTTAAASSSPAVATSPPPAYRSGMSVF
ncbi:hypothetical protein HY632_03735 [Candidatus Uhrbacteria bacterium]|nr:hypothetical protein [Candidatus Uhrbacteria bacterium]